MLNDLTQIFAAMDGAHIPGGCDSCNAYQTPRVDACGVMHVTVRHDEWCPVWRRIQRQRGRLR